MLAVLARLALGVHGHLRPRHPAASSKALAPASIFDQAIWVTTPRPGPGAGTAFSVDDSGVWLTARHVVEGCARTVIVTAPGRGVEARARMFPGRETALLYTRGGAPALPIADPARLLRGERALLPGFPDGRPGEATALLQRRANLVLGPRGLRAVPVLVLTETGRSPAVRGALTGLSGGPVLDSEGRVIGVTVAEAPRRRRLYAAALSSLRGTLEAAGVTPSGVSGPVIDRENWRDVADALRARLSVAEVECLGD